MAPEVSLVIKKKVIGCRFMNNIKAAQKTGRKRKKTMEPFGDKHLTHTAGSWHRMYIRAASEITESLGLVLL